jgi:glycine/D-amino acid oxidase-like deaminating enzyme
LSGDGHEVLVFEAEAQLGYHASGRSAAMFEENYGNATVRALNRATGPGLARMGVLSRRGILMVALPEDVERFEADRADMGMEPMSVEAARAMVPILSDGICRAALHEGAMDIDTDALLQGLAREARGHGARIETGARVEAVHPRLGVTVDGTEVPAEIVVNAAGAWADEVARLAGVSPIGLQPYRRSMARLPAPGGHDVRGWPMLFGPGESWYAKPDAGGWIVSPAEEDPVEPMDAWADDMVLAEGLARYEAHVTEPVTRVETNWAGLRTFAPDRALVIGEEPTCPGFFWSAGQGGYGFQTSLGAAAHLAAAVAGGASPLGEDVARALSPARFR